MSITEFQRKRRKDYIGSSDAAAILGVNPYENAYDIWLQKTGKLEIEKAETPDMSLGRALEKTILDLAEQDLGSIDTAAGLEFILDSLHIISHPDGIVLKTYEPVEAKESGIRNPFYAKENWGEANTDQVPDMILIQTQVHILATKKSICHIPTILGGRGYVMFFTPEDKELQQMILNSVGHFWDEHIVKDIPPENVLPTMDVIKRIRRQPNSTIDIPKELVEERETAQIFLKSAEKDFEIKDMALRTALGTAEAGRFDGGLVTYFLQHRNAEKKIREAYDYRCLRIKRDKNA